jgi:hypothetical protein
MTDLSMRLSKNFTLRELVRSEAAERVPELLEKQNNPPMLVIDNLRYLCAVAIQPVRDLLGVPITVNSGYRCDEVNTKVGGSDSSQHVLGEAADIELHPAAAAMLNLRATIDKLVMAHTGKVIKPDADPNAYLFAYIALNLDKLDVDQLIHEYGAGYGKPAWVHVSASQRKNKREIVFMGKYVNTPKKSEVLSVDAALARLVG